MNQPKNARVVPEGLAALFFLVAIVILATHYGSLPLQIQTPIHGGGDRHGMGGRDQLWLLIFMAGWMYVLMSLINLLSADAVNSSHPLTAEQREKRMEAVKTFMAWCKAFVMVGLSVWVYLLVRR